MTSINLKIDRATYNANASSWLELLIKRNYKVGIDLQSYQLIRKDSLYKIDLQSEEKEQIFRNITFLINGLEEYQVTARDKYGRMPFDNSFAMNHNCHEKNVVQEQIEKLLHLSNVAIQQKKSKMIISHDIDSLHSGFIYELYFAFKTLNFPAIYRVLIAFATTKSLWWNLDEIVTMLEEYDFKSVFYFIVEKGLSDDGIKNADYEITDSRIQAFFAKARQKGFEIGLHKSSLNSSIEEERIKLNADSNRHHYLRYTIPELYRSLSKSNIRTDSSLCFPYNMGFRNSYGLPFQPFDLQTGVTHSFLEIPFQIMDGMFKYKSRQDAEYATNQIINFLDQNRYNAILGMLWHNTDLNNASKKHSLWTFINVLKYLHEVDFETVVPAQVYNDYFE